MDKIMMRDFNAALEADLCKASICHVCLKRVKLGTDVVYCSRCKNITYCSKACQKNHWHEHKAECLKQKRSSQAPVTDPATFSQMLKEISALPAAKAYDLEKLHNERRKMQAGHSGLAQLEAKIRIKESKTIDDDILELSNFVKMRWMEVLESDQDNGEKDVNTFKSLHDGGYGLWGCQVHHAGGV